MLSKTTKTIDKKELRSGNNLAEALRQHPDATVVDENYRYVTFEGPTGGKVQIRKDEKERTPAQLSQFWQNVRAIGIFGVFFVIALAFIVVSA